MNPMNLQPENEDEARALELLARFEAMMEKELGPLGHEMKHEARLMLLKKLFERCTDEQLQGMRQKLAEHPTSGKAELGSLDLIDGIIAQRSIARD